MTKLDNSNIKSLLESFNVNTGTILNVMKKLEVIKKWTLKMQKENIESF